MLCLTASVQLLCLRVNSAGASSEISSSKPFSSSCLSFSAHLIGNACQVMLPKAQGMSTQKQQAITHRPLPVTPTTRSALPSPSNAVGQATAWSVIGDRLNIDQNQISELVPRTEYDLDGLAPISKNDRKTSPRSPAMYADPRGLARAESTIVSLS